MATRGLAIEGNVAFSFVSPCSSGLFCPCPRRMCLRKAQVAHLTLVLFPGIQALLWRQYLLKKRSLAGTIVELLSPIVLISLLVRRAACIHTSFNLRA